MSGFWIGLLFGAMAGFLIGGACRLTKREDTLAEEIARALNSDRGAH